MERGTAWRLVLALAAVTMVAAIVSLVGGSRMEVQLVGVGLALTLVAALFRARGMVPGWPATSGSVLPTRVMHPRSSNSRTPSDQSPKAG